MMTIRLDLRPRRPPAWAAICPAAACVLGALCVVSPKLALGLPAVLLLPLLMTSARARLLCVAIGALLTFQSSSGVSSLKSAYLACFITAFGAAVLAHRDRDARSAEGDDWRRLHRASYAIMAVVLASAIVAVVNGTSITDWSRDAFAYALFASVPVFARDFAVAVPPRLIRVVFIGCSSFAVLAFFFVWIMRRHTGQISVSQFAFSSFLLSSALVGYGISQALFVRRQRIWWCALSAAAALLLLATATRSTAVLGVTVAAAAIFAAIPAWRRYQVVIGFAVVGLVIAALLVGSGFAGRAVNLRETEARLTTITSAGSSSDRSVAERRVETRAAMSAFRASPLLGQGPGHALSWSLGYGISGSGYYVDSPAAVLEKLGLLGTTLLVWFVISLGLYLRRNGARASADGIAVVTFLFTMVAWSVIGMPIEDKGASIALMLLLALFESRRRAQFGGLTAAPWSGGRP